MASAAAAVLSEWEQDSAMQYADVVYVCRWVCMCRMTGRVP